MITTHQLTLGAIVLALVLMLWTSTKESFTPEEKKCLAMAKKSQWKKYDWQSRKEVTPGVWKCAQGWEDTKCNWGMGKQYEKKQCRRLKSTRTGGATDETKCTSNDQCGTDFVCLTRSGTCGPKYNKTTNTTGYCSRNSHCGEGMVCTVLNKCVDPNNHEIGIISGNWNDSSAGSNSAPAPVTPSWTLPDQAIQNALAKYTGSVYKACNISVKSEDKPTKILESILAIPGMSGAFVIVAYLNSMKNKADATGHVKNYHIECQAYEYDGDNDQQTKGYDIYIWAPGAKGNFVHKDKTGFSFWAMTGGKFNDNWRWGKDRKNVTIEN